MFRAGLDRWSLTSVLSVGRERRQIQISPLRLSFIVALLLPCEACLVGPDFSAPSAPIADNWIESKNPSVETRNQEYRDWWKVFHDPVLDRLIQTAYNQNLSLVSAGTRVLEARARLGVVIGEFYPQLQEVSGEITSLRRGCAPATRGPRRRCPS